MIKLYKASMEGCVITLNSLLQNDPLLLSKISLTSFGETPLHISSLLGHANFVTQLVTHKPTLALELDSLNRSSLHLASAEGHFDIVQTLLQLNYREMCFVKDQDGRTPLHYAAMRGRVGVIELLINANKDVILEVNSEGETAYHLCVQYNHLEALKVLVEFVLVGFDENKENLLNMKEQACGNTILHLAVMLKQLETVKYLLTKPEVKQEALNHKGYKASDLVDPTPRDFNTSELILVFKKNQQSDTRFYRTTETIKHVPECPIIMISDKIYKPLKILHDTTRAWLESDIRGSIMVVATLIAQMTFQTAINPPGGVWQESSIIGKDISGQFWCSKDKPCIAGTAVLADVFPVDYLDFMKSSSIAFLASMSVILVMVGGLPLRNTLLVWLMVVALLVALSFSALTFLQGMIMVSPNGILHPMVDIYKISLGIWIGILAILALLHTIFVIIWLLKKLKILIDRLRACY